MKKNIAILSLIAIFACASTLSAQPATTTTTKTEQKACCKGKCSKDKKTCKKVCGKTGMKKVSTDKK